MTDAPLREALEKICQRANEGRPGEMSLIDTIHAMHAIATDALAQSLPESDGTCPGGVDPGWDECPKCGATMDDSCAFAPSQDKEEFSVGVERLGACAALAQPVPSSDTVAAGRCITDAMIEAGAQALANDVWHPPQKLSALGRNESDRFRKATRLVLEAALALPPQDGNSVSVDLMSRIWANLFYDEEGAGNTFQQTLNEVVDWLHVRNALPSPDCFPAILDDLESLVARFTKALLAKLKLSRANGRSGWDETDWEAQCQAGLLKHVEKGDPRDVAAYCAFMWHHGWATKAATPSPMDRAAVIEECAKVCEDLRHPDLISETEDWSDGTMACADAIRALALPRAEQGGGK